MSGGCIGAGEWIAGEYPATNPDKQALLDLADRCERASGPSFVLEQEIGATVGWTGAIAGTIAPPYTASIDAAMTLVPVGWGLECFGEEEWTGDGRGLWFAQIGRREADGEGYREVQHVNAATPALALTAAALRARSA